MSKTCAKIRQIERRTKLFGQITLLFAEKLLFLCIVNSNVIHLNNEI